MYTVLRFDGLADKLEELGQMMNSCVAGLYTKPDHTGNRFSFALSEADNWQQHCDAIRHILHQIHPAIETAHQLGFALQIDVAIEPADYAERWITGVVFTPDLLHLLQRHQIAIFVTVYGQGPAEVS